jgi:hypothetical protein
MQEIRDYIYGPSQMAYLYGYPKNGKKCQFLGCAPARDLETKLQSPLGDYYRFEILGTNLWKASKETMAPHIPQKLLNIISSPTLWDKARGLVINKLHTVWGGSNLSMDWELLYSSLPTVDDMKALQKTGTFDKVVVCQYTPKLSCVEVCEMIVKGGFEPRYPQALV